MPELPSSFFPIAERQDCSEALQKLFADLESRQGFVPNVMRAFAWREARFWKWWAHRNDLMTPSAGLSKTEREMVAVVVSAANDCLYCMTSHGYALRVLLGDPVTAERITLDYRRAGLDARLLAMLDYAVKITRCPAECALADIEGLRQHGFNDADIWDIAEIAAMYNYTNRLMSATGVIPNPEYHGLAR
ncbi:MAG: peroxidase-related enzyme [Candidatus Tectimicrobiota bacterium]